MFQLENKISIVTGGGSGIGRAISRLFSSCGARVFILDLDGKSGEEVVKEISEEKHSAVFKKCNVSDQAEVKKIMQEIAGETGAVDILINNAGVAHVGNAENTGEEDFDRLFRVNVKGMYNCLHETIPFMKQK